MSIEVSLRHCFGAFALEVDFIAPGAGVTALFGPSGAGKTSIVHAIAGLWRADTGRIAVNGRLLLDTKAGIAVKPQARRIGLVFQEARLFPHMRVEKNLLYGWRRAPQRASAEEIARVIALLGLENLLARLPRHLSGGEKSRVALGRALLAAPDILLLDEPLAALDAARRDEILPYLEKLRDAAKVPILYVSHALDGVARLADHIVILRGGRVEREGAARDLLTALDSSIGMGAVIDARLSPPRADGLSELLFDGGALLVPRLDGAAGETVRVRIAAQDILISREEPRQISANNILPALVLGVRLDGDYADVQLGCGATRMLARITTVSATRLELAPGAQVFAIIKSVIANRS
ncbi:MAG TPA: molybdenum ABC transporter ATP-binding protein [Rhizomicrobium sp.]